MQRPATQILSHSGSFTEETVMQSASSAASQKRCAYCQEPFYFTDGRMQALPAGNQFVCNEFCAQALREEAHMAAKRAS